MEYGLQLYSMRDAAQADLQTALATVAAQGYRAVEFAGFFDHTAQEVRGWLDANGLRACGTHTGWQALEDGAFAQTVAYHKTIGASQLIIPGADLSTREKLDAFIAFVGRVQPRLAAEGIQLGFHNHSVEFLPNQDGLIPHQELCERTDLMLEIDTYWAWVAGQDPVALLERLADRVPVIHLKDGLPSGDGLPLGQGQAPLADVVRTALAHGMQLVVESETQRPSGPAETAACIDWLRRNVG